MLRIFQFFARQNSYFISAFAFGFFLSTFFAPLIEKHDCIKFNPELKIVGSKHTMENDDIYEPKINLAAKPKTALKAGSGMIRPRFHKAELGIRNKLFVGVLTSPESISSFAVALNKTASKFVDKMMFFIDAPSAQRLNVSSLQLPGIVGFTDTRKVLKPFHLMKYVSDNFLEDYDFFFIIKDTSYIQAQRLYDFTKRISIAEEVHLGRLGDTDNICSLNSGILLSNSVVRKVQKSLEWCVKNFISKDDSVNMGQCIIHATKTKCSEYVQGSRFQTFSLKRDVTGSIIPTNPDGLNSFKSSIVVSSLTKVEHYYYIHLYFLMGKTVSINEAIEHVRGSVVKSHARAAGTEGRPAVWPAASQPHVTPLSHFDVVRWEHFTQSRKYLNSDFSNIVELSGSEKEDIQGVVDKAISHVEESYNGALKFYRFFNGYKRCDPSRGVDYIIDAEFRETTSGKTVNKRLEVFKSLGKIEMVPVPYVTENVRVHVIIPVKSFDIERIMTFLKHYSINAMEKKDLQFLMLVFIYSINESSKGEDDVFKEVKSKALSLSNKFERVGNLIKWHSIKLPTNTSELLDLTESLLDFVILDSVLKKFTSESLVLYGRPNMEVRLDYFNRVRMNTVSGFQIFSPIPFAEYHPEIIYNENHPQSPELEINKNNGHYDSSDYKHVSFYTGDYFKARKTIEDKIPLIKYDKDILKVIRSSAGNSTSLIYMNNGVYNMFIRNSKTHMLRAVEPSLRLKHPQENCAYCKNTAGIKDHCTKTEMINLATRSQLGRLVLDYQAEINNVS